MPRSTTIYNHIEHGDIGIRHGQPPPVIQSQGGNSGNVPGIEKVKAISQDEIVAATGRLVRKDVLKHVRSVTTDNGGEFSDYKEMCKTLRKVNRFLKIYYTHAYAAREKGSVENANRHIRRFRPKGSRLNHVSRNRIKELQDFINSIPRASRTIRP